MFLTFLAVGVAVATPATLMMFYFLFDMDGLDAMCRERRARQMKWDMAVSPADRSGRSLAYPAI